ncbi:tumor necrosis factor receptor superfamily member 18 isoform X2 [Dasypus novemcinctus]|uniref:tumor necrosis factor receptor superfamily member 18 isoform X2 n=1 Tax=Dasypus novemcinctus TaxID=9361 RepID=UPI00265F09BA|nr:tumor necrosis factor receptor superfamily member 18 isoform X2 [Dasypus novemcinctus]
MGALVACCGLALLCVLGLGQQPSREPPCGLGRALRGTGLEVRCCSSCVAEKRGCPEPDCTCATPEYHCADPQCSSCKHHTCLPGQRVQPQGRFVFGFECIDCAPGTFSGGHDGHCKPWTDCSRLGLPTVFPGNMTHDATCTQDPPAAPRRPLTAVLLAVAVCVLVLVSVQLSLHVWQLKRWRVPPGRLCPGWGSGAPGLPSSRSPPMEPHPPLPSPPAEDACSCQFPEEERGERTAEEKGRLGDLWV